jgi:hypothetical protein
MHLTRMFNKIILSVCSHETKLEWMNQFWLDLTCYEFCGRVLGDLNFRLVWTVSLTTLYKSIASFLVFLKKYLK